MAGRKERFREILKVRGLRATAPRLGVLRILDEATTPLSHSEVLQHLGDQDWDPATVYRNLIKLTECGIAVVVDYADGMTRYALAGPKHDGTHSHAHFVCNACGTLACLPSEVTATMGIDGQWHESVRRATVQLRGECPNCLLPT